MNRRAIEVEDMGTVLVAEQAGLIVQDPKHDEDIRQMLLDAKKEMETCTDLVVLMQVFLKHIRIILEARDEREAIEHERFAISSCLAHLRNLNEQRIKKTVQSTHVADAHSGGRCEADRSCSRTAAQ